MTRAIRKACDGLSHLAAAFVKAASQPGTATERRRVAELRASPVSIDHQFGEPTPAQKRTLLPLVSLSLGYLYQELLKHRLWSARFDRGGRSANGPAVRSLATRHLGAPATDGWNVVAGAVDLANAWAFSGDEVHVCPATSASRDLPRNVRMRLIACLSVAWKFERQLCSRFPREFHDEKPNLVSPHTCELAYLAYAFLSQDERAEFGAWNAENRKRVRELYEEMVALEVALLTDVPVFSTLVHGNQVQAETRIQELFDAHIVDAEEAMIMRSIVPFFNAAWQNGYAEQPSAGALVCAAMHCTRVVGTGWGVCAKPSMATLRAAFVPSERRRAKELVQNGLSLKGLPTAIVLLGCYADPQWVNYEYMRASTLKRALSLAHAL